MASTFVVSLQRPASHILTPHICIPQRHFLHLCSDFLSTTQSTPILTPPPSTIFSHPPSHHPTHITRATHTPLLTHTTTPLPLPIQHLPQPSGQSSTPPLFSSTFTQSIPSHTSRTHTPPLIHTTTLQPPPMQHLSTTLSLCYPPSYHHTPLHPPPPHIQLPTSTALHTPPTPFPAQLPTPSSPSITTSLPPPPCSVATSAPGPLHCATTGRRVKKTQRDNGPCLQGRGCGAASLGLTGGGGRGRERGSVVGVLCWGVGVESCVAGL